MSKARENTAKTWVLVLTSVASFMVALDALVVTTALSTIRADLGASIETLEWIVNAYNLTFAVLLLTGGASSQPGSRCSSSPRPPAHCRPMPPR